MKKRGRGRGEEEKEERGKEKKKGEGERGRGRSMQKIEVKDYLLSQNREFQTEVHLFIQKCAFDTPFS